jgi:hypothetical protein
VPQEGRRHVGDGGVGEDPDRLEGVERRPGGAGLLVERHGHADQARAR